MNKNIGKKLTSVMVVMIVFSVLWTTCFAESTADATTETVNNTTQAISNNNTEAVTNSTIIVTTADYYADWNGEPTLQLGSTGSYVEQLQALLNFCMDSYLVVDGVFGTATRDAVIALQNYSGTRTVFNTSYKFTALTADGIVGPYTWGKLNYLMSILSY